MIRVIYSDKSAGTVSDQQLDDLINNGLIVAFYRSSGWVSTQQGPIRGRGGEVENYDGPERRKRKHPQTDETAALIRLASGCGEGVKTATEREDLTETNQCAVTNAVPKLIYPEFLNRR